MTTIETLQKELDQLKERNKRVDANKAWETSLMRKALILILTYAVIVIFLFVAELEDPFVNAIIPSTGFFLSTLTVPVCKKWWIKRFYKN
ncbi:MAG: hypothetical protein AAB373_00445 [Patescibacteria group bacterium]